MMTVDDAALRLRQVLDERAARPASTLGPSDSALLVALAEVVLCYVRRELVREATRPR